MYKLFYSPGACSMAVHIALHETGAAHELHKVDFQSGQKDSDLLKVNPHHQVPALIDGDTPIFEGAAILIHILEKENSPLLPKAGPERIRALQWLCWANASLHPKYSTGFSIRRMAQSDAAQAEISKFAVASIQKSWDDAEQHLARNKYLAGDQVTIGDILMTVIANWSPKMPGTINIGPNVTRVLKEISNRPGFLKAMEHEGVEYKMAA